MPAGHVYVRHLAALDGGDGVTRLADPKPCGAPSGSARWWPPVMLDPAWVREHAGDFDVFHLHFGFDAQSPARLEELVRTLRELGKPLVYTVHDLRNPHHRTAGEHEEQLDVLVPAAAELITLTPGAARRVAERWGRVAAVLPHPHVVELADVGRPRPPREGFTVGVHAKSLRPNMAPLPVIDVLAETVAGLPGARLRVDIHPEVEDPDSYWYAPHVMKDLRERAADGALELHVHDYFSDRDLFDYLQGLDLSVLPYVFGTHSGWLEACHDLGTPVAVSDCGFYAEQRPCLSYRHDEDALDADGLREAVRDAYERRPVWRADPVLRAAERRALAAAHRQTYLRALG
ncbi:glycosyltransferase family 1 protein [Actinomadura sp. PM05-2]|uniref:Glycosyltransferase family 1 protein n=1 Tax=Actinomadura parmotrematis TaxID=2864039 RepID=A0ABS7G2P7_9ACTN|nr:glycosyltransferase family 1 protein [Actinomadura parmotrematis]